MSDNAGVSAPIFAIDTEGWVSGFESVAEAEARLESPDVDAGEYLIFDACGHVLDSYVLRTSRTWWQRLWRQDPVGLRLSGNAPQAATLAMILLEALGARAGSSDPHLGEKDLDRLVALASAVLGQALRAPRASERILMRPRGLLDRFGMEAREGIRRPVILDGDGGGAMVFRSVDQAVGYVEAIDVKNGEYVGAWDAVGRVLLLSVEGDELRSFRGASTGRVVITAGEAVPSQALGARDALTRHLQAVGALPLGGEDFSLDELLCVVLRRGDVC